MTALDDVELASRDDLSTLDVPIRWGTHLFLESRLLASLSSSLSPHIEVVFSRLTSFDTGRSIEFLRPIGKRTGTLMFARPTGGHEHVWPPPFLSLLYCLRQPTLPGVLTSFSMFSSSTCSQHLFAPLTAWYSVGKLLL